MRLDDFSSEDIVFRSLFLRILVRISFKHVSITLVQPYIALLVHRSIHALHP